MIHLVKLCVGVTSVEDLEDWRAANRAAGQGRPDGRDSHRTRMTPKRADEMVGQGSLYWVIGGFIRGRQPIVDLEPCEDAEGRPHCRIVLSPGVIRTVLQPRRPFQGWRYLRPEDAPPDIHPDAGVEEGKIAEELARLGLL